MTSTDGWETVQAKDFEGDQDTKDVKVKKEEDEREREPPGAPKKPRHDVPDISDPVDPAGGKACDIGGGVRCALEAHLELNKMPVKRTPLGGARSTIMSLSVQANVDAIPDAVALVLCLDVSASMGDSMGDIKDPTCGGHLMVKALRTFVANGIPGKRVFLRFVTFGRNVKVLGHYDDELVELTDETRPDFVKAIDAITCKEVGTNIEEGMRQALDLVVPFMDKKQARAASWVPTAAHVVLLTDGVARGGIEHPDEFKRFVDQKIGGRAVFTHFLGVGFETDPKFMDGVTESGTRGVFQLAAAPAKIMNAYEAIFGATLEATGRFDIQVQDATGTRIEKHGMLKSSRKVLVENVTVHHSPYAGKFEVASVSLVKNGKAMPESKVALFVEFSNDIDAPTGASAETEEAVQMQTVERDREEIMATSASLGEAFHRLEVKKGEYKAQGFGEAAQYRSLGNAVLVKQADEEFQEEAGPQYRSLSAGPADFASPSSKIALDLLGAQMKTYAGLNM